MPVTGLHRLPTPENFAAAAEAELAAARPLRHNTFKIDLTKRIVATVLGDLTGAGWGGAA